MLRDLIRNISNGIKEIGFGGMHVSVVDERGEIAALYKGIPQNDLGIRTDVLENIPKPIGIKMLIRSMSPQIIAADEIGTNEDVCAIKEAVCSGVKGIFTAHGESIEELLRNPILGELIKEKMIDKIAFLNIDNHRRCIQVEDGIC